MRVHIYRVMEDGIQDDTDGMILYHEKPDLIKIGDMPVEMIGFTEMTLTHTEPVVEG